MLRKEMKEKCGTKYGLQNKAVADNIDIVYKEYHTQDNEDVCHADKRCPEVSKCSMCYSY